MNQITVAIVADFPQTILAVAAGFLLDCIFGDPHRFPHIVRLLGRAISALEPPVRARFPKTERGELLGGAVLSLAVILSFGGLSWALLSIARMLHPALSLALEAFLCYQLLAARSLYDESTKVQRALEAGDLAAARAAVAMIVGRDTDTLSADGVARAAVETVAENASDGVIAPLFFLLLGGAPLGLCYKAINTLDSMIGYKNERYLYFGRFAARLDDLVNFIPARISALLMIAAAPLCGLSARGALRVWRRDRKKHASPNSAQTEATCAGALGVELVGDAVYGGILHRKPTIGDPLHPIVPADIARANRLMYAATLAALLLGIGIRGGR